jgi:hypothetical protein
MFVEIAGVQARFRRRWEEGVRHRVGEGDPELAADLQGFQQAIEGQARKMFALGVIGEAASLYAIAAGSPSEYLGSLCVLALGSFLYLMWSAFETHIAGAAGG